MNRNYDMETVRLMSASRRLVSISREAYEVIFSFITETLLTHGEITVHQLLDFALQDKTIKVNGDLCWLILQVKRDLEVRGVVRIRIGVGVSRVQKIKLVKSRYKAALTELRIS